MKIEDGVIREIVQEVVDEKLDDLDTSDHDHFYAAEDHDHPNDDVVTQMTNALNEMPEWEGSRCSDGQAVTRAVRFILHDQASLDQLVRDLLRQEAFVLGIRVQARHANDNGGRQYCYAIRVGNGASQIRGPYTTIAEAERDRDRDGSVAQIRELLPPIGVPTAATPF